MMSNNKILTVSYGTFSCTLEGFDDSFGTMKAIAEYFRDLSAGDRYFGAEPAQPDAQMLAHIAQQEISRRVEAREQDGNIVLSAQPDATPSAATPAVAAAALTALKDEEPDAESHADTSGHVGENPAEAVEEIVDEIVEHTAEEAAGEPVPEPEPEVEAEAASAPVHEEAEGVVDIVPGQPDSDIEAFFAAAPDAKADFDDDIEETPEAPAAPEYSSIADKLQRIRAVVSQQDAEDDPEYIEDEHAAAPVDSSAAPDSFYADDTAQDDMEGADAAGSDDDLMYDALRDIEEALLADEAVDAPEMPAAATTHPAPQDAPEEDEISAILARLGGETAPAAPSVPAEEAAGVEDGILAALETSDDEASDSEASDDQDAPHMADMPDTDTLIAELGDEALEQDASDDAHDNLFDSADETDDEADHDALADAADMDEAPASPPRVRVLKVKRSELEAAIISGELEEYDDEEDESSLSDDDEAELARELAELEAELTSGDDDAAESFAEAEVDDAMLADDDDADDAMLADEDDEAERASRHGLPEIDEDMQEGDMSRLMAKTDSQMGDAESAGRRDAFSHLRAAVAAKKADAAMGEDTGEADQGGAYRDDLASVVRPRRPVGTGAGRTARPEGPRPAPLKLVAEQRVDIDAPRNAGPVRPRRVGSAAEDKAGDADSGFAEFAEEMGATNLPDMLEAAAAYMSFVEGRDQFTRPQLMTKVRQAREEEFSREDGLRWFGKLLRDGKLQKKRGGRFEVSEEIGFKPDARAAG